MLVAVYQEFYKMLLQLTKLKSEKIKKRFHYVITLFFLG